MATIYRVKWLGKEHPSKNFPAARPGYWYPATEQLHVKAGGGGKVRVKYSAAMLNWLRDMQFNEAAARALFRIGAVLFNIDGNEFYRKLPWPLQNYIPLYGRPWPQKPVAQGITCGRNLVRGLEERKGYVRIETIKAGGSPPKGVSRWTQPWLFCFPHEVQVESGAFRQSGLCWPLLAEKEAWISKKLLEKA